MKVVTSPSIVEYVYKVIIFMPSTHKILGVWVIVYVIPFGLRLIMNTNMQIMNYISQHQGNPRPSK